MLELRDYQSTALDGVRQRVAKGEKRVILVAPTGSGKCLGRGTTVLMYNGDVVPVEEIEPGDQLMGPDSRPRTVLSACSGHGPLRKIVPRRGDPWICNDAHVLTLVHTETSEVVDVSIEEWRSSWSKWKRHLFKQFSSGVDFPRAEALPVDPYFLGVWFGDGTKKLINGRLSTVAVSKPDAEIVDALKQTAEMWGCEVGTFAYRDGDCPLHRISTPRGQDNPLLDAMRDLLGERLSIPKSYLVASRRERLEFLAGWIDTDGYVNKGIDLVQKRKDYCDGVAFLARSLGFRVKVSAKIVSEEEYWRLSISGEIGEIPTRIARKKCPARAINKDATRTGFSIEDLPDGPWFGFTLDGDGRFLLGNFVVTHNTVMAASVIHGAMAKGNPVIFLAHRKELIDQPSKMLDSMGIDHGVIKAKHWRHRPHLPVQVASVQTLQKRGLRPPAKIIIVDEAHRTRAMQYEEIFEDYPDALILGLTATPVRLDGRGLGHIFQSMVKVTSVSALIESGRLCMPRLISLPAPDMSDVEVSHGEFNGRQASAKIDGRIIGNVVEHWLKLAKDRTTIVFAPNVEKSREIVERFVSAGVRAAHVDGSMGERERGLILSQLATGEIKVVSNVNLLVEGFDLPIVSCVSVVKPTKSITQWLQMCGRGSRPDPSKDDFIIIDHAGCFRIHGSPTHDWDWSLEDGALRKESEEFSICTECFTAFAKGQRCPTCGSNVFTKKEFVARAVEETDDELEEIDLTSNCPECNSTAVRVIRGPGPYDMRINCGKCSHTTYTVDRPKAKRATMGERKTEYFRLRKIANRQGFKPGWADHKYSEMFAAWPAGIWKKQIGEAQAKGQL